jgi:hypothetical protein
LTHHHNNHRLFLSTLVNHRCFCHLSHPRPKKKKKKASLFLFSVLAAIAAAKTSADVVNNKPSPAVQDKSKTIKHKTNATHEAGSSPTALEEHKPSATQHKANTSVNKRKPTEITEREAERPVRLGSKWNNED